MRHGLKWVLLINLLFATLRSEENSGDRGMNTDRREMTAEEKAELSNVKKHEESLSSHKYLEMLKKDKFICNPLVRQSFGLTGGENFLIPRETTWRDRKYCPGAFKTCCDHRSIAKVMPFYQEGRRNFRQSWGIVVETLALFKGLAFEKFLRYNRQRIRENCMYILDEKKSSGGSPNGFFEPKHLQRFLFLIDQMSIDLKSYINNNEFIFGGLICTVCSPKYNRYFWMNKSHPVFKVSMSMCAKLVEMNLQLSMLAKIYEGFLKPIAKVINCLNDRDTDPDFALPDINMKFFKELKNSSDSCSRDFDAENPDCRSACKINFFSYVFPGNLVDVYKVALKVIFEEFAHTPVEKYYQEIKGLDFEAIISDKVDFLNPNTKEAVATNMKDHQVDLRIKGMNVFYNHINVGNWAGIVNFAAALLLFGRLF